MRHKAKLSILKLERRNIKYIYKKYIYILYTIKGTILQLIKVANKFNFYISSNYIKIL